MNFVLSPTIRRVMALAIFLTLIGISWSGAVQPLFALVLDRRADIDQLSQRVVDLEKLAARRSELEYRLRDGRRRLAAAGGFWTGASAAAIAADVEDRMHAAVAASGGRVTSTSATGDAAEFGFRRITVHCTIEGTLDTLEKTLAAIENTRPALFADNLTVSVRDNAADNKGPPLLDLDLDVTGYSAAPGL
jgi:general secretion pathway protein M